jgi:hypothetical protein
MAIMPHCAACGFYAGSEVAGSVRFADYAPDPNDERVRNGEPVILGSSASGVAEFCRQHLGPAQELRHLTLSEALQRVDGRGSWSDSEVSTLRRETPVSGPQKLKRSIVWIPLLIAALVLTLTLAAVGAYLVFKDDPAAHDSTKRDATTTTRPAGYEWIAHGTITALVIGTDAFTKQCWVNTRVGISATSVVTITFGRALVGTGPLSAGVWRTTAAGDMCTYNLTIPMSDIIYDASYILRIDGVDGEKRLSLNDLQTGQWQWDL